VEPDTQNYQIYKATLYIQMQLCRSETLKEWLRRPVRIVSLNEAHDIVRQILLGLDHIHRKNFVHNDIKARRLGGYAESDD
jgi:serine/threonine protein kinase